MAVAVVGVSEVEPAEFETFAGGAVVGLGWLWRCGPRGLGSGSTAREQGAIGGGERDRAGRARSEVGVAGDVQIAAVV